MARHAHEFQCTNCSWFNYPPLRDDMHGNYTIICGNKDCKHEHYRVIKNGVVTEDRHNKAYGADERIIVLFSQTSKTRRKLGLVARFRQMEAAGLAGAGGNPETLNGPGGGYSSNGGDHG